MERQQAMSHANEDDHENGGGGGGGGESGGDSGCEMSPSSGGINNANGAAGHASTEKLERDIVSSTIVIKVGTSSLVRPDADPPCLWLSQLSRVCEVAADLTALGHKVCLVTSGAVGVGCQLLGLKNKPTEVAQKQALAAVGQQHLMRYYDEIFSALGRKCGQVLITLENVARYGNIHTYIAFMNTHGHS